jgi:hypothetical protein
MNDFPSYYILDSLLNTDCLPDVKIGFRKNCPIHISGTGSGLPNLNITKIFQVLSNGQVAVYFVYIPAAPEYSL